MYNLQRMKSNWSHWKVMEYLDLSIVVFTHKGGGLRLVMEMNIWFRTTAYVMIAGVFGIFGIVMNLFFGFVSWLHLIIITGKQDAICLIWKNMVARVVSLAFSIVATLLTVIFSSLEFSNSSHHLQYGQCFYAEICVLITKLFILILFCISQRRTESANKETKDDLGQSGISVTRASGIFSDLASTGITGIQEELSKEEIINSIPGARRVTKGKREVGSISTLDTVISMESDSSARNRITMPMRPSLKKDKKENDSLNSTTSSVSVRFDIKREQTEF